MLCTKPKDVTYTQMAIIIDEMSQTGNYDDDLLFRYIYCLVYMLSSKARFFKTSKQYDDFTTWVASDVYFRVKDKNKTPLKSILNYIKSIIYFRKITFVKTFKESINNNVTFVTPAEELTVGYTFGDMLSDSVEDLNKIEFECCLSTLSNLIEEFLQKIPHKKQSFEWTNIYVSCMLTFLNSVILPNYRLRKIATTKSQQVEVESYVNYLKQDIPDEVILFHLEDNMHDYIKVLVKQLKHYIANELGYMLNERLDSNSLNAILLRELNGEVKYDQTEERFN